MPFVVAFFVGLLLSMPVGAEPLVEGRVRLSSGGPVAQARVLVFDLTALERGPVAQATTDGAGHFALRLSSLGGLGRPDGFALGQNYPNPFNPSTVIPYQLATAGRVRLEIFNVLGQRVATLVNGDRSAGVHTAVWDATDEAGRAVGAGVYIYRLRGGGASWSRRMVLVDGQAGTAAGASSFGPAVHVPSEQAERTYGLVVSGAGFVPYVDAAFSVGVGMGSVELVVEPVATLARGKALTCGILGDVNNDGLVDVNDALLVMVFHFDPSITAPNEGTMGLGDVTADGQVNLDDVLVLITYLTDASDASLPAGIGQATSSCSNEPGLGDMTTEEARAELTRRGIASTAATFIDSARTGNLEVVKLFVTAGWSVDVSNAEDFTPLRAAAEGGHLAVVQYLVGQGASLEDTTDDSRTLLHYAASGGSLDVVQYLVMQGANVNATDDEWTLLHEAASGGSLEVVQYLVMQGANVNATTFSYRTPLHAAAEGGHLAVVQYLVMQGANVNATTLYGETLLHYAASGGSLDVVQYLVGQGANLEATNDFGWTLLHYAAWGGSLEIVEYLVEQGANINATDNSGRTAKDYAQEGGHSDVVEYLESVGVVEVGEDTPVEPDPPPVAEITPEIVGLYGTLVSSFTNVFFAMAVGGTSVAGEGGGSVEIEGNQWTLQDFSPDGALIINGTLNVSITETPIPLTGTITLSGSQDAELVLDMDISVGTDGLSATGTIAINDAEFDVAELSAAAAAEAAG